MATFTNQAQLSYNGVVRNSNITIGEIAENITMTKTAVVDTYSLGEDVTYILSIVNTSGTNYTNLTLTDDLGAISIDDEFAYPLEYKEGSIRLFVNGILQTAPTVTSTQPLKITGINVPANGNISILYEATVTNFAPLDAEGEITNTANISSVNNGTRQDDCGESVNVTATETIRPEQEPDLTISKALSPTTVTENGQITYTFVIANYGNTATSDEDNVVLTDTFNPILSGLRATLDGVLLSEGTDYSYNTTTGEFATAAGVLSVPAATFETNPDTGEVTVTPGTATLVITGTV